jgi:hypothetical protein
MKKYKAIWIAIFLIGALLTGCTKQEDENQNTAPDPDKRQVHLIESAF